MERLDENYFSRMFNDDWVGWEECDVEEVREALLQDHYSRDELNRFFAYAVEDWCYWRQAEDSPDAEVLDKVIRLLLSSGATLMDGLAIKTSEVDYTEETLMLIRSTFEQSPPYR